MKTKPDNLLTPEERELAQLTRRLGPQGGPSPALDARILAAADAAVATRPARTPKPRWPVAIGLAASVVFAVGIAWQLRPVQQAAIVTEAPVAYSPRQPSAAASHESKAVAGQAAEAAEDAVAAETTVPEAVVADARGPAAAACHLARTVTRRAERRVWALARAEDVAAEVPRYLNRLSDLLFVIARVLARHEKGTEVLWRHRR